MALTQYTASTAIIAALADLPNATSGLTAAELKAKFDENPAAFKAFVNALIAELEATTDGSSGADQIGATAITSLTGATVQALLESLRDTLKGVTDAASGADFVGMTAISETGANATVQSIVEALITRLKATTDSASGADLIGSTAINGVTGATVQTMLESIKTLLDLKEASADITNNRLLSASGNFTGTLDGYDIVAADPGLSSAFTALQADIVQRAINVKYPPSPLVAVAGGGVTDDTASFQALINYAILNHCSLYIPNDQYVISDTLLSSYGSGTPFLGGFGFKFIGQDVSNTVFLIKMIGKPVFKFVNINNGSFEHGVEIGNFTIKEFSAEYKNTFDGVTLVNCIGNIHKNINVTGAREALLLTTNNDTAIAASNTGYCEQNVFEDCFFQGLYGINFRVGANDTWNSSYHGNIFDRCVVSVAGTALQEAIALNIESGLIYNCAFNIKIFISGVNSYLFHLNADSGTNVGNITYEVFGSDNPKIRTGDNALTKFFFNGNIHGLGTINWSEYYTVQIGELDYSNSKIPIIAGNLTLGRDKIFTLNLLPPKQITAINLFGKQTALRTLKNFVDDLYHGITNYFCRYQNTTGSQENGFIMACKEETGAGARLILGTIPETKNDIQDMVPGFYFRATGSYIKSVPFDSQLNFNALGIGISQSTVNVATTRTPVSATATGAKGDICWDANYIYVCIAINTWKRVAIAAW